MAQRFSCNDDASFCSEEDSFFADGAYDTNICRATNLNLTLEGAASTGKIDLVQRLVEAGADINFSGGHTGCPPLCLAIRDQNIKLVKWLVEQPGLDINKHDDGGKTPLYMARRKKYREIEKILMALGANDNTSMVEAEDIVTVDRLLQEGADIDTPDEHDSNTLLHIVCSGESFRNHQDQINFIIQLLERGSNANARNREGETPLHRAASTYHDGLGKVTALLDRGGADIEAVDNRGNTALLRCNQTEIIALLLERGANVNARDEHGNNKLHSAGHYEEATENANLDLLFRAGIVIDAKGYGGNTPLIRAIEDGKENLFCRLLKEGADPNITNGKGWNALHTLSDHPFSTGLDMLLQSDAIDVNVLTKNRATTLHLAVWSIWNSPDRCKAIAKLLEYGADVNAKAKNGSTPLGGAVGRYADLDTIKALLDHGADANGLTTWPQEEPDFNDYGVSQSKRDSDNYHCEDSDESDCEDRENSDCEEEVDNDKEKKAKNDNEKEKKAGNIGNEDKGKKETPLLMAIKGKHKNVALLLLDRGADPNATNEKSESPIILGSTLGLTSVVNRLLTMGVADGSWEPTRCH